MHLMSNFIGCVFDVFVLIGQNVMDGFFEPRVKLKTRWKTAQTVVYNRRAIPYFVNQHCITNRVDLT